MARVAGHDQLKGRSQALCPLFLPALLITKIGSELRSGSTSCYLIVLIWALTCHAVSFLISTAAHLLFGMPDWTTVAVMLNNTTSYPLLLIGALEETGILKLLTVDDESTSDAVERAKSYFLIFSIVSSCLTFAIGPRLIDSENAPEPDADDGADDDSVAARDGKPDEETGFLDPRPSAPFSDIPGHVTTPEPNPPTTAKLSPATTIGLLPPPIQSMGASRPTRPLQPPVSQRRPQRAASRRHRGPDPGAPLCLLCVPPRRRRPRRMDDRVAAQPGEAVRATPAIVAGVLLLDSAEEEGVMMMGGGKKRKKGGGAEKVTATRTGEGGMVNGGVRLGRTVRPVAGRVCGRDAQAGGAGWERGVHKCAQLIGLIQVDYQRP